MTDETLRVDGDLVDVAREGIDVARSVERQRCAFLIEMLANDSQDLMLGIGELSRDELLACRSALRLAANKVRSMK